MRVVGTGLIAFGVLFCVLGCSAKVETTDDSTKGTLEGPKIEIGDKPVDMNPSTDKDVDVDTPAPGDK